MRSSKTSGTKSGFYAWVCEAGAQQVKLVLQCEFEES